MKKIIIALISSVVLFACGNPEPDKKILKTDKEFSHWAYDAASGKNQQVYKEVVTIEPTWSQAFHYAYRSGYTTWLIVGFILLAATSYQAYRIHALKTKREFKGFGVILQIGILFIGLAGAGYSFYDQPGNIRWSNQKKIDKVQHDAMLNQDGGLREFWDGVYNDNRMIGAAVKK